MGTKRKAYTVLSNNAPLASLEGRGGKKTSFAQTCCHDSPTAAEDRTTQMSKVTSRVSVFALMDTQLGAGRSQPRQLLVLMNEFFFNVFFIFFLHF